LDTKDQLKRGADALGLPNRRFYLAPLSRKQASTARTTIAFRTCWARRAHRRAAAKRPPPDLRRRDLWQYALGDAASSGTSPRPPHGVTQRYRVGCRTRQRRRSSSASTPMAATSAEQIPRSAQRRLAHPPPPPLA